MILSILIMGQKGLKKFKELNALPMLSLLCLIVALIIILTVIKPDSALDIVFVSAFLYEVIDRAKPTIVDKFLSNWNNMSALVHAGLLLVLASLVWWVLSFFIKNYKIIVVPRNSTATTTN